MTHHRCNRILTHENAVSRSGSWHRTCSYQIFSDLYWDGRKSQCLARWLHKQRLPVQLFVSPESLTQAPYTLSIGHQYSTRMCTNDIVHRPINGADLQGRIHGKQQLAFGTTGDLVSKTVADRWVYAARHFDRIDSSFCLSNFQRDCPRGVPRRNNSGIFRISDGLLSTTVSNRWVYATSHVERSECSVYQFNL